MAVRETGPEERKRSVLFICAHNSARSQMAEGYLRARYGDRYEVFSAGSEPTGVHPMAVRVMREIGVDISSQRSKPIAEFAGQDMDLAVTVCDAGRSACPFFPWAKETLHREFPDPAQAKGPEEAVHAAFTEVRDRIASWIDDWFGA